MRFCVRPLGLAAALLLGVAAQSNAQSGAVFVVTTPSNGGDSHVGDGVCDTGAGGCSLRAAIQEANALPGLDTITFAIGSGIQTINVTSELPTIADPVVIDGTTQPGYAGAPLIVLNGGGGTRCLTIGSGGTTLRGLALVNFFGDGLELDGSGNVLEANYIGMMPDGTTAAGNSGSGIVLQNSSNNRIGGATIPQRNLISGNTGKGNGGGILINGGSNNTIQGNFIGVDISGTAGRGNQGRGIALSGSSNNVIGGPNAGEGNLIAGNRATGVRVIGGGDNVIQGNYLGIDRTGTTFIANDRGVQLRSSNGNRVLGNIIAGHRYDGILVWQGASNNTMVGNVIAYNGQGPVGDPSEAAFNGVFISIGTGNAVYNNRIFGNGTLGILLALGGNNMQAAPTITTARVSGGQLVVAGTLNSTPNTAFLVQLFASPACDSSGAGEGQYILGNATLTTNGSGAGSFGVVFGAAIPTGWVVTATAADPAFNTSMFSTCRTVS